MDADIATAYAHLVEQRNLPQLLQEECDLRAKLRVILQRVNDYQQLQNSNNCKSKTDDD